MYDMYTQAQNKRNDNELTKRLSPHIMFLTCVRKTEVNKIIKYTNRLYILVAFFRNLFVTRYKLTIDSEKLSTYSS